MPLSLCQYQRYPQIALRLAEDARDAALAATREAERQKALAESYKRTIRRLRRTVRRLGAEVETLRKINEAQGG